MNTETTIQKLQICRIKFPQIALQTRDAHKLRGYFGTLFKQHSPILHNHYEDGRFRYKYPSIQYKVVQNVATLIGVGQGAELLPKLFLQMKELDINGKKYNISSKNIELLQEDAGYSTRLYEYRFATLWMALNQKNYAKYQTLGSNEEKEEMLNAILVGHLLSFYRNMGIELAPHEHLMTKTRLQEKSTLFKENRMLAFTGTFFVNAKIPTEIGLGKAVSRGFGTIIPK